MRAQFCFLKNKAQTCNILYIMYIIFWFLAKSDFDMTNLWHMRTILNNFAHLHLTLPALIKPRYTHPYPISFLWFLFFSSSPSSFVFIGHFVNYALLLLVYWLDDCMFECVYICVYVFGFGLRFNFIIRRPTLRIYISLRNSYIFTEAKFHWHSCHVFLYIFN